MSAMKLGRPRVSEQEREALDACQQICVRAFQNIRTSAYRREACEAPEGFDGDYVEWIRLVADACDGLARPRPTALEALTYRRSVWSTTQTTWVESVLSS